MKKDYFLGIKYIANYIYKHFFIFFTKIKIFIYRYLFKNYDKKQSLLSKIISIALFSILLIVIIFSLVLTLKIKPYIQMMISEIDKPIEIEDFKKEEDRAISITDRNGKMLATLYPEYGGKHIYAAYSDIPKNVINAVISAEDKNFFSHNGIDFEAILRAVILNIKEGKIVSGGSTITQQLIKNIKPRERTYKNKMKEALEAIRLEKTLSKEEILSLYLNRVFFGNNLYGIAAAADVYFKKNLNELTISESAMLSAIIKSGTMFNPYKYQKSLDARRKYVLKQMLDNKYISKEEYKTAYNDIPIVQKDKNIFITPHFSMYVLDAVKKLNIKDIVNVRTTLDLDIQREAEEIIMNTTKSLASFNVRNIACVILDAKTGEIISMIGSLNYNDTETYGMINGATSLRQPGSALKPFLYAYVFEKGENPASLMADIETFIPTSGGDYVPVNYSKKYYGPVRIRTSLANSLNVSTVRWLQRYRVDEYQRLLRSVGFNSINKNPDHYGLTLALGSAEVTLLDLATAYTTFANDGMFINNRSIFEIKKTDGSLIIPKKKIKKEIISKETSYLITNILSDYNARLVSFPGLRGIVYPFSIALKTGTSKDFRDAWVAAYTKDYIVAIWLGDFGGTSMHNITGGNSAVPIMYDLFLMLNKKQKQTKWNKPKTIVKEYICPISGKYPSPYCPSKIEDVFDVKNLPDGTCDVHKLYRRTVGDITEKQVFVVLPKEYERWSKEQGIKTPSKEWALEDKRTILLSVDDKANGAIENEIESENNLYENEKPIYTSRQKVSEIQESYNIPVIVHPKNNSVYSIDGVLPIEYQRIELQARGPKNAKEYIWYCDGKEYARKPIDDNTKIKWQIEAGTHSFKVLTVLDDNSILESVKINIHVK